jgi:PIN like domain
VLGGRSIGSQWVQLITANSVVLLRGFEVLQKVGDRLWVPHQVMKEFWRNRVGVLASRGSGTVQVLDALGKQQRASADAIRQWAKSVAAEAEFQDRLLGKIEALYTELEDGIRAQAPR